LSKALNPALLLE